MVLLIMKNNLILYYLDHILNMFRYIIKPNVCNNSNIELLTKLINTKVYTF